MEIILTGPIYIYAEDQKGFLRKFKKRISKRESLLQNYIFCRHLSHGTNALRGYSEFEEIKKEFGHLPIKSRTPNKFNLNCWANEQYIYPTKSWKKFKGKKQWMRKKPDRFDSDIDIKSVEEFIKQYPEYINWRIKRG